MITTPPTSVFNSTQEAGSTQTAQSNASLGQSDFLTLLISQLQNQDPLSPMENAEFTTQMAQFSSLEQLIGINSALEALAVATAASNGGQAMSLIGKGIKAEGNHVQVDNGQAADISFDLPDKADEIIIKIEDENGNVVKTITQGSTASGSQTIKWDGLDDNNEPLADGLYNYSVIAKDSSGNVMDVTTYTRGIVNTVSFENGVAYVQIGDVKFTLSEIIEVTEPKRA